MCHREPQCEEGCAGSPCAAPSSGGDRGTTAEMEEKEAEAQITSKKTRFFLQCRTVTRERRGRLKARRESSISNSSQRPRSALPGAGAPLSITAFHLKTLKEPYSASLLRATASPWQEEGADHQKMKDSFGSHFDLLISTEETDAPGPFMSSFCISKTRLPTGNKLYICITKCEGTPPDGTASLWVLTTSSRGSICLLLLFRGSSSPRQDPRRSHPMLGASSLLWCVSIAHRAQFLHIQKQNEL